MTERYEEGGKVYLERELDETVIEVHDIDVYRLPGESEVVIVDASDDFDISKPNRRRSQEPERQRQVTHPFTIYTHTRTRQEADKRGHQMDRKAAKR